MSTKVRRQQSDPLLTVAQAAERRSVHPSTIRRWIDRGRLPAYRVGEKRIVVKLSELTRLVIAGTSRHREGGAGARPERALQPLSKEERRRGLRVLAELERLGAEIAAGHGRLVPESWELLNRPRDQRSRELMQTGEK